MDLNQLLRYFQSYKNITDSFSLGEDKMRERKKNVTSFEMAQSALNHLSYANRCTAVFFFCVCSAFFSLSLSIYLSNWRWIHFCVRSHIHTSYSTHTNKKDRDHMQMRDMWIQAHTGQYLLAAERNCKYAVETQKRKYQNHGLLPFLLRMQNRYISDEAAIYLPIERGWCGAKRAWNAVTCFFIRLLFLLFSIIVVVVVL